MKIELSWKYLHYIDPDAYVKSPWAQPYWSQERKTEIADKLLKKLTPYMDQMRITKTHVLICPDNQIRYDVTDQNKNLIAELIREIDFHIPWILAN